MFYPEYIAFISTFFICALMLIGLFFKGFTKKLKLALPIILMIIFIGISLSYRQGYKGSGVAKDVSSWEYSHILELPPQAKDIHYKMTYNSRSVNFTVDEDSFLKWAFGKGWSLVDNEDEYTYLKLKSNGGFIKVTYNLIDQRAFYEFATH